MSVAGLQEGIAQDMKITCNGGWGPYGFFHHCDEHHGAVDIHTAIPFSCDTFYYMLGDKLGIDRIAKYATEFGYGQKTGIDLPGEQAGLMPSAQWKMKNYHARWYPDETLDVAIGQGAVEATPIQLARIIGGIASGGHMVRPHVVFPDQLPEDFRNALPESFPGSGDANVPIDPDNWTTITDGMYQVTQPGYFHTAGSAHLEGIDFGGKTGTAQLMSHEALDKTAKGRVTRPNVWFVGVTPRRNPGLVVAVLWQNGEFSYYPARIGAAVVSAYVEKQRRLANNLVPTKTAPPAEMSAVWTVPGAASGAKAADDRVQGGNFLVDRGQIVAEAKIEKPPALKGHDFKPALSLPKGAGIEAEKDPASAAEGMQRAGKKVPQGLKPLHSFLGLVGASKAAPFQSFALGSELHAGMAAPFQNIAHGSEPHVVKTARPSQSKSNTPATTSSGKGQ